MPLTPYAEIDELLGNLLEYVRQILGKNLTGFYLYGSLVTGDFDGESSDIDLLAVTAADIEFRDFDRLQKMHDDFVSEHPQWDDRIEIAYVSVAALRTFKSHRSQIAVISPGEPFHIKEAGKDWLINWWVVREKGVAIFGPPPATLIELISKEEFVQAVREQAKEWGEWISCLFKRKEQAYAILTMCRALYACQNGEQASKQKAAQWAQEHLPQWASLIQKALVWREAWRDDAVDHMATFPDTVRFVHFVIDRIGEVKAR